MSKQFEYFNDGGIGPAEIRQGLHGIVLVGECSLEEAWKAAQEEVARAYDPHGVLEAVQKVSNTTAVSAEDLPEEPRAFASSLVGMMQHIFEGPDKLDVATDPRFLPFMNEITEAWARVETMRAMQATNRKIHEEIMAWNEEHDEDLLGQQVTIQPIRKGVSLYYAGSNVHSAHSFAAQLGDVLEGRIGSVSLEQGGGILLEDGVYKRERIDGRLLETPLETDFTYARIESLVAYDQDQGHPVELPLAPESFLPRVAITPLVSKPADWHR